eukprot:SAG31_NODE_327_length_17650_cov_18.626574_5_plen_143_part_00
MRPSAGDPFGLHLSDSLARRSADEEVCSVADCPSFPLQRCSMPRPLWQSVSMRPSAGVPFGLHLSDSLARRSAGEEVCSVADCPSFLLQRCSMPDAEVCHCWMPRSAGEEVCAVILLVTAVAGLSPSQCPTMGCPTLGQPDR